MSVSYRMEHLISCFPHILKILNSEQGCGSFKQTNKIKFGAIKLFVLQFETGKLHCTIGTANFKRRIDQIKTDVFFH